MKKLLLLVIISLALFSCEGPMGPQGPQGVPGEGMYWKYYTYTVKSQDWELVTTEDGLNTYYMYILYTGAAPTPRAARRCSGLRPIPTTTCRAA